ncbi:enoyl-CoA hydratase-related protein [Roseateles sp. SL47]|uniref:enoyl-CoA hydratase-related protein n=1 Tax=Roseateles sp. SL47 TaxID=2995138 RepID=UPI00226E171C|nr:enoyl-CoA hydratase-related protein [Roseateles sp. SL47]WAC75627.1 enoyl-CoA hydratase-related protein [Roseateles sp. SL47]
MTNMTDRSGAPTPGPGLGVTHQPGEAPHGADPVLLVSTEGAVRVLTLNRPQALNAFTTPLLGQLRHALDDAAADTSIRAVLITGAGRAFCAGQDLNDPYIKPEFEPEVAPSAGASTAPTTPTAPTAPTTPTAPPRRPKPKDIGHLLDHYYIPLALRLRSMPVPTICAVNGVAAGAGANFALGCDLVMAGRSASFIQAFSRIGLVPDCGGTWLLTRLVGRARAMQLTLLGEKLPAEQAQQWGLIARCVPDEELASAAMAMAQQLAGMPTRALVQTRAALDEAMHLELEDALRLEARLQSQLGYAHDYLEGAAAFLDKRTPQFKDR